MSDQRIPISQLSETQTAPDASYIAIDDGSLTKKITVENFNSTSTASAQQYANQAAASAQTVEDNIATSAAQIREATLAAREATQASTAATASATSAYDSASLAQNYSVNAATSAGQAMNAADTVAQGVTDSKEYAEDSEAWAVGKRNGSDVPSSDVAYHNNAKYYSDNASSDADRAEAAAESINVPDTTLTVSGVAAESKATGDRISSVNAELADIRVMTDGETAVTAGDAVREQVSEITYKMARVVSENYWNEGDVVSGYKAASGSTGSNNTYEYLAHAIPVTEGDVVRAYEISTVDRFTTAGMRWLCALDANRNPVASAGSNSNITSYTVPSGIAYVIPTMNVGGKKRMITINKEATAYVDYEMPHYIAGDGFHSDISMTDTDFDTAYLDWSRVNRMNPSACQTGKSINTNTGIVFDGANYFVTDFMEIREGETLHMITLTNNPSTFVNRFAAFDKDKNILPALGRVDSSPDIAQTGEMAYIRVVFIYNAQDIYRTPYGIVCMPTSDPEYIPGFGAAPEIKTEYLRPAVKIMADDTARTVVDKLVSAYSKGQCDIYFERATYDLSAVVASVKEDYHLFANEIPIGNDCRYFFNGATIKASVDLLQHPASGGEEFYCNLLGCQRRPSSYELHDGVLEATDTRYVVHDESSALKGSYKHLYQNMEMIYHTNARTEAIRKCIGGGTGASGVVEIVGCKFITDGSDACVSFHGNGTDVTGAQFDLNVRDSWLFNSLRAGELSASQTARLQYCGNSAAAAPSVYAGWTATIFNNEIR